MANQVRRVQKVELTGSGTIQFYRHCRLYSSAFLGRCRWTSRQTQLGSRSAFPALGNWAPLGRDKIVLFKKTLPLMSVCDTFVTTAVANVQERNC